jgi:hypothetical protein
MYSWKYHPDNLPSIYDVVFEIYEATNIDWKEISSRKFVHEFIMDNFKDKLDWGLLWFNNTEFNDKRIIHKYRSEIFKASNIDGFFDNMICSSDSDFVYRPNASYILNINPEKASDLFLYVCKKGDLSYVRNLVYDERITINMIKEGFLQACQKNNIQVVEFLLNFQAYSRSKKININIIDESIIKEATLLSYDEVITLLNNKLNA